MILIILFTIFVLFFLVRHLGLQINLIFAIFMSGLLLFKYLFFYNINLYYNYGLLLLMIDILILIYLVLYSTRAKAKAKYAYKTTKMEADYKQSQTDREWEAYKNSWNPLKKPPKDD